MSRDAWEGDELQPQSMSGWSYVESNPINATDPTGLYKYQIWVAAFIAPPEVAFPYPYAPFATAFWHGDNRGYYRGNKIKLPIRSSRVWHSVIIDTNPQAFKYILNNDADTGVTRVRYFYPLGPQFTNQGKAPRPIRARISRDIARCIIRVHLWTGYPSGANPLTPPGTPAIDYEYRFRFNAKLGRLTVRGTHDPYPAHEVFVRSDDDPLITRRFSEIETFSPYTSLGRSPGSGPTYTPADLAAPGIGTPVSVNEAIKISQEKNCSC